MYEKDTFDIDIPSVDEKFLTKLQDISFIFTKFANVESVKNLFNDDEMFELEEENAKYENAFYYLNKHINKLVNSDSSILIDPINGDYKQSLTDIFVTNDATWINVTHDNFQPYILPEKMLLIRQQVIEDRKYINDIIESNNKMIYGGYGGYGRSKHCSFDYIGLVEIE